MAAYARFVADKSVSSEESRGRQACYLYSLSFAKSCVTWMTHIRSPSLKAKPTSLLGIDANMNGSTLNASIYNQLSHKFSDIPKFVWRPHSV